VDTYTNRGPLAATPLPLPTQTIVGSSLANRQLWLPQPAAIIPIAVAELENMLRAAGVERALEAAVAVERT
jgi:hypothetical protein